MYCCQTVEADAVIEAAAAVAGFVGDYFVAAEGIAVVVVAVVAATFVATVTVVVARRCFAVTFDSFEVDVVPFVTSFAAITAWEIVATESVVAAAVAASVRD